MHQNNGYTLIEITLVLSIISIMMFLIIPSFNSRIVNLNFEAYKIKALLLENQKQSIINHEKNEININKNIISSKYGNISLNSKINCGYLDITFNEAGNINMANTIECSYYSKKKDIILNLGNGNIYVK